MNNKQLIALCALAACSSMSLAATTLSAEFTPFTLSASTVVTYGPPGAGPAQRTTKLLAPGGYLCGNDLFGDPAYGVLKSCTMEDAASTGSSTTAALGIEGNSFTLATPTTVTYGIPGGRADQKVSKLLAAGTYTCGNGLFGDPAFGTLKACTVITTNLSTPRNIAGEWGSFTLTVPTTVTYGANGKTVSKLLQPGTYECGNGLFGDPVVGTLKSCTTDTAGPVLPTTPTASTTPLCEPLSVQKMAIDTANNQVIDSKDTYLNATLKFNDNAPVTTRIRGRGNSTWDYEKKPYRIKLDANNAFATKQEDKDWTLLANYADKTMMRNAAMFCLSNNLKVGWVPKSHYVELTLNKDYVGVYQVAEQVEVAKHKVDIGNTANTTPDLGYLVELDVRLDGDIRFVTPQNVPFVVKSDATTAQSPYIVQSINKLESDLYSSYKSPLVDMDSWIDYYLVQELSRNTDGFATSTYFFKKENGTINAGPVWDFDSALGNYINESNPYGWLIRDRNYMGQLFRDPVFEQKVKARWAEVRTMIPAWLKYIDVQAATLQAAQERNFQRWDTLNKSQFPSVTVRGSYQAEVDYLKLFIQQRVAFMDSQLLNK